MYVDSASKIPNGQAKANSAAAKSDSRIASTQCRVNKGRMSLFNTTPPISSLVPISPELAANGARILAQSAAGRASVVGAGTPPGSNQGTPGNSAPRVQPLNGMPRDMNSCGRPTETALIRATPLATTPTMPKRGPMLVNGHLRDVAVSGSNGLSGVAPPWGNAVMSYRPGEDGGLFSWVKDHPFISLALVGGLVYLGTDERRRARRGY